MYKLIATHQEYHWGKPGPKSAVAELIQNNNPKIEIDNEKHYAELWMGAHVKSSSVFTINGEASDSLRSLCPDLPFLLKVLSVDTALSIQAHPNKSHAEVLHSERPEIYKDPNHKPEMCVALTNFEGLCGFRQLKEINNFLEKVPGLAELSGLSKINNNEDLKTAFGNLMKADADKVSENLKKAVSEIDIKNDNLLGDLLHRLNTQYPGDIGVYCIYYLNRVLLNPGEGMFLSANVPHAYLDGNCVECMACSDNVVRAGLTPKLRDVDVLVGMLNYEPSLPEQRKAGFDSEELGGLTAATFKTPIKDFLVMKITRNSDNNLASVLKNVENSEAIYLCTQGSIKISNNSSQNQTGSYEKYDTFQEFFKGSVGFTPKNFGEIEVVEASDDLVLWRATVNYNM